MPRFGYRSGLLGMTPTYPWRPLLRESTKRRLGGWKLANLRLLIVDPDVNYRTELRKQLVRGGIDVVGETDYGAEAVTLTQAQKPDAVAVAWQEPSARCEQTLESLSLILPSAPL